MPASDHDAGPAPRTAGEVDRLIGSRIRMARALHGLSQAQLGDRLHLSAQQIRRYERGENRVAASTLFHLAAALDTPIGFFFGADEVARSAFGHRAPGGEGALLALIGALPAAARRQLTDLLQTLNDAGHWRRSLRARAMHRLAEAERDDGDLFSVG